MITGITPPQALGSEAYGCVWGTNSATLYGGVQPEMLMPGSQQGKLNKAIDVYRCACSLTCVGSTSVCGSCAMCQTGGLCTLVPLTSGLAFLQQDVHVHVADTVVQTLSMSNFYTGEV